MRGVGAPIRIFFKPIHGLMAMRQWSGGARTLAVLGAMLAIFLLAYILPFEILPADGGKLLTSGREALLMLQDYARHHVMLCLVPALFIAGAIASFVSQAAVMKYFGAQAHKVVAYSVAAVSGTILAACSCTILPLFAGIHKRGAGLGPAVAFLYSGPAINVLAIILTARVLGWELGVARAVGAIVFSVIIGLTMHLIYRKEEAARTSQGDFVIGDDDHERPMWQTILYFGSMIGILVFANWKALDADGIGAALASVKWIISGVLLIALLFMLGAWFGKDELNTWVANTWAFAKQILPLLFVGVLVAGILLGRPGHPALIPESWIAGSVGGNGLGANLFASFAGALMYFATLTEVPILEGLLGAGMGKGPALALLLAGPALSLPNMLVIRSVMGTQKTVVYVALVVVLSTMAGMTYGAFAQ
ncbi:MAG: permease [Phycisphaerae bacterium]|nr:MAG: permease [Phycisphaerae bacterium]